MSGDPEVGRAIFLNGGSSSGKSTIGRALQSALDDVWLLIGIDVLIWLLPVELVGSPSGFSVVDGAILRGPAFRAAEEGFHHSVAALCRAGLNVVIDDVLVDGEADQHRWETSMAGVDTLWVGVHCDGRTATARESDRGDRPAGVAMRYADSVHRGVHYDVAVDTGAASVDETVDAIIGTIRERWGVTPRVGGRTGGPLPPRSALGADGTRSPAPWER